MFKKALVMVSILVFLFCPISTLSVSAADFTNGVDVSGNTATIWFKPLANTSWVDVHYKINSGAQQNIRTTYNSASGRYEQNVTVSSGDTVSYSFTYNNGTPAYDSAWYNYTVGSPSSPTKAVTFYEDINYGGASVSLQPGNYTLSQLNTAKIPNDWMTSLKVPSGWTVEVYENDNFTGTKWTYTSDTPWVGNDANDKMTSVKIYSTTNTGGDTTTPPLKSGFVTLQVKNNTNGQYSNDQIYWAIVGKDPATNQFVHVDLNGNLIPMKISDNDAAGHLTKTTPDGTFNYSNYFCKVSQQSYAYIPKIIGARMYISYGEPLYIKVNQAADGLIGYAGPNLANTSDPNTGIMFEWAEMAWTKDGLWINTTRVDQFCYPYNIQLVGNSGYNKTYGDTGTRADLMNAYKNSVPAEFKSLVHSDRIYAPASGLGTFTASQANAHYFDSYINDVYNYYATHELTFKCDRGTYSGHVVGNDFVFNKNGGAYNLYIHGKPSTQEVLLGNGIFDGGNDDEKAIKAQVCAAFNRHVMLDPAHWNNSSYFYKDAPANYFAKFWHDHSYENKSYGFCYDDVFDFSSTLHVADPKYAIINVGW
ncbi:beta-1,3-glucanase family protein [Clostridium beijerinckii]|uniref:beta-1,3-glucanase family protein n=1 Tax=Clostridium beijerinckii TaxID=1520 RepID=UPI001361497F|nr:beta-1,3-glucanase family protein [Clostridium beijerinckii]MZK50950.1 hypothetical protein [Clostridium beijerinckii]MZK59152.1 hypothetical protein [Clostridium beijerinckii]MZK69271.1 hypothetical protein [Clostridium beijerinckii]MZK74644.1 hypothetical protein [Clostridium beijerinckii]MZK84363.1 hypothetical protein [Clostridium beijerinckii]